MTIGKGDLLLKGRSHAPEKFDELAEEIARHEGYVLHRVMEDSHYGSEPDGEGGYRNVITVKLEVVR